MVEIHRRLKNVYSTSAVDESTVRRWTSREKAGERDLEEAMQQSPHHSNDTNDFALSG